MRVELFGDEVESLRWFSTFTQRSLADAQRVEIAPAAELDPEYRELAEMAAEEESEQRPDVAEVLPVDRFRSFLDLVPDEATVVVAAEEELRPALADHWQDVTTSLHSDDAHDLYLPPDEVGEVLEQRANVTPLRGVRGPAAPVPRAGGRHRGAHDHTRPSPSWRSSCAPATRRWSPGTGAARPSAPPTTSRACGPRFVDDQRAPRRGTVVRAGAAARGLHRAAAEARRDPRPPPAAPPPRRAAGGHARPRVPGVHRAAPGRHRRPHRPRHRPLHRLRHQDGRQRDARLPRGRVPRRRPRVRAHRPARPPDRYVGADGAAPPLSKLGSKTWDNMKARAKRARRRDGGRADQPLRGAQAPRGPLPTSRTPSGSSSSSARSRTARPTTSSRRSSRPRPTWSPSAADGPPDLRRRRLRQDRGRAARRVQGGRRRQAGAGAGADDDPRAAALRHVLGAPRATTRSASSCCRASAPPPSSAR